VLIALQPSGQWHVEADVAGFEGAQNPAGGPVDANPYGLLAEPGVRFVVDAGGNSLLEVRSNGSVSLVAIFSPIPVPAGPFNPPFAFSDAVPTEVGRGPDGALYVSTLTGVPFLPGAAAIYRVVPGQAPQLYAGGFTQITDFDWGPDGSLYVVQHASAPFFNGPGALIRVAPGGARTVITTALQNATGVLAGPDGAVYVSHKVHAAGAGEVLRIVP
jgi:glucose/arabinose dehydrogenase